MAEFCKTICGVCAACRATLVEIERMDAIYELLDISGMDAASPLRRDPDDPRTFALDSKGCP